MQNQIKFKGFEIYWLNLDWKFLLYNSHWRPMIFSVMLLCGNASASHVDNIQCCRYKIVCMITIAPMYVKNLVGYT